MATEIIADPISCEDWANLPDPIITQILSYLTVTERCRAATICKHWLQCLDTPLLWRTFNCGFYLPAHGKLLKCVEMYGHFVSKLTIVFNQKEEENRKNAVAVLERIADLDDSRLTHLTIKFKGENPLFYAGHEFVVVLTTLFVQLNQKKQGASTLRYLNFSDMQVNFEDDFINCIAENCPNLEYLNILNRILVCNVSPDCISSLVHRCRKLKTLHLYHASLSDDVLNAFTEPERSPLQRLGIVCRRQDKYGKDLSSEMWSDLMRANPDLTVELGFDHTCPLYKVSEIMKPEIPVIELHLVTFTRIDPEINMAVSYYEHLLRKLVVQTRPSKELQEALLSVATRCRKLRELYVYCVVEKQVIDRILDMCPEMKEHGTYILRWRQDPEPWTVGQEEGE